MTSYMVTRLIERELNFDAAALLARAYNDATNPAVLRTDREHQLQRIRARLLRDRIKTMRGLIVEHESGKMHVAMPYDRSLDLA